MDASQGMPSGLVSRLTPYNDLIPTTGYPSTPLGFSVPSTGMVGPASEPHPHPQFLDINKLPPSMLLAQDPSVFSGVDAHFDEAAIVGFTDFLQANNSTALFT